MSKHSKHQGADQGPRTDQGETASPEENAEPVAAALDPEADASGQEMATLKQSLAAGTERIATLEAEVSSLKDQYLRKLADYENFRKRLFREKEDAVQYANTQLLLDMVGVIDDFDRAVRSSETSKEFQSLHDGVDMIRKGLLSKLESRYGLARFDSLGVAFDPNLHEAVMSEQGDCQEPVVIEEFVKGYKLRDRVLRSAKVKVRMPSEGCESAGSENTTRDTNA